MLTTIWTIFCKIFFISMCVNGIAIAGFKLSTMIHEENEKKEIVDYDY